MMNYDERYELIERIENEKEENGLQNPISVYKTLVDKGNCFVNENTFDKLKMNEFLHFGIEFTFRHYENGYVLEIK